MATKKNNTVELVAGEEDSDLRLDVFCAATIDSLSRNQIQKVNKSGGIAVDGVSRPDHYALSAGEVVVVVMPAPVVAAAPVAQDIPLSVVYEDDDILVINKHAGIVVHPAHGNWEGTVVNAVLGRGSALSTLGGNDRPGVVHRLDKDTSGLMVLAKSDAAYKGLSEQIKNRHIEKTYHAIVLGTPPEGEGRIEVQIDDRRNSPGPVRVVPKRGRHSVTDWRVLEPFRGYSLLEIRPRTGRMHQVRVSMRHQGYPLLVDTTYGGRDGLFLSQLKRGYKKKKDRPERPLLGRLSLHARRIELSHPLRGERMGIEADVPKDMELALKYLRKFRAL